MIQRVHHRQPGPGGMYALSLCCHLAIIALLAWWQLFPEALPEEPPVTYVDMVNLPVASPQVGVPATGGPSAAVPAVEPPPPPAAMTLPAPKAKVKVEAKPAQKAKAAAGQPASGNAQPGAAEDDRAFRTRMERIEQQAEDRRQAEVLARLRKPGGKVGSKVGMPTGSGTQAGSDYAAYLKSRLTDAFGKEMAYQTKSPVVQVTITVASDGHFAYRVERSSGDPLFDSAVARAVTLAGKSVPPPPGGKQFKHLYYFAPEGVVVR